MNWGKDSQGHATTWDPGTSQRDQHPKNPSHGPQGQGQQTSKEWSHI